MESMLERLRRCVADYQMIVPGDTVAVGVSGGKDSMALLRLLHDLKGTMDFRLEAITIDLGFPGMDFTPVAAYCAELEIPYTVIKTQIKEIVFDVRQEKNPCSMCAKMRRGALNNALRERGITKLALGHHHDDAVETLLMSLIYEGRFHCFQPVTYLSRSGMTQIRPMLYLSEQEIRDFAAEAHIPIVENSCPADKTSKRHEIKELISELSLRYPELSHNVFAAMQRFPLPEWETK